MNTFTATQHATIKDKELFFEQFKKFVKSDYAFNKFPKWFYTRLLMCFGHIAHYNQLGFYDHFFATLYGKIDFIQHCCHEGVGDPAYTFADVERQIRLWLQENYILLKLKEQNTYNIESAERAEYERLKKKYE